MSDNLPRDGHGKLLSYTFPGCYPIFYLDYCMLTLCADCANIVEALHGEGEVIDADVNYECTSLYCDECSIKIPSAYGEDE